MKVIKPYFEILTDISGESILKFIEKIGRTAYKSEDLITEESYKKFLNLLMTKQHESVIEHFSISVKFVCTRGFSHELVRHRIASYTQESTRYCNYSKGKFGGELTFIKPLFFEENTNEYSLWFNLMEEIEKTYLKMIEIGVKPEQARSVLPNSLKTEIVATMNLRSWRNFFKLRCDITAHPEMRELSIPLLEEFKKQIPIIFDNIV